MGDLLARLVPDEDHPAGKAYVVLGVAFLVIGAFLIHCYYDRSGRGRPFVTKLLPGP